MQTSILALIFILVFHSGLAAIPLPTPASFTNSCYAMVAAADHAPGAPPRKKNLYDKGKGKIGLFAGLLLGPVGFLGVRTFSRNRTMRKQAKKGFAIWLSVVAASAIILLMVCLAKGSNSAPNLNFGGDWPSSIGHTKEKKPDDHLQSYPAPINLPRVNRP